MSRFNVTKQEDSILKRMFLRSHTAVIGFSMVKMQSNGFTLTMAPAINEVYKDDEEGKKEAFKRTQNFFNTNTIPFSFIAGLTYALEKEKKEKGTVDGNTIENIKAALMGPTAGMFDSIWFNAIRVIAGGIGIGLCAQGNILGTILFILLFAATQCIAKYYGTYLGYTVGTSFIDKIFNSGLISALTKSASVMGLMMIGYMIATLVNVPIALTFTFGENMVSVAEILDSIFPGILGLGLTFLLMNRIKKGMRPPVLILIIFVVSLVGAFFGIF